MAKQSKSNGGRQIRGAHPPLPTFSFRVFRAPVSTIMETNVVTVFRGLSVEALLQIFLEDDLRRAPVVDERSRLVGFVSFSDLVIEPNDEQPDEREDLLRVPLQSGGSYHLSSEFHLEDPKRTVEDIMTAPPVCLPPSATMSLAAALMAQEACSTLPVVDAEHRVIGVLTARALLRWFAQADDYLIPERSSHKRWVGWEPSTSGRFESHYGARPTAAEILDTTVVDASTHKR